MDRGAWWAIVHGVTKSWTKLKLLLSLLLGLSKEPYERCLKIV